MIPSCQISFALSLKPTVQCPCVLHSRLLFEFIIQLSHGTHFVPATGPSGWAGGMGVELPFGNAPTSGFRRMVSRFGRLPRAGGCIHAGFRPGIPCMVSLFTSVLSPFYLRSWYSLAPFYLQSTSVLPVPYLYDNPTTTPL